MRLRFINNYPLARDLCERGLYPRQHLWAVDRLEERGHTLVDRSPDVLYFGNEGQARIHALARRARLGPPLAVVYHHPPRDSRNRHWIRGIDLCICLSEYTTKAVRALGGRAVCVTWGPDLSYDYTPVSSEYVVCAGKSGRDYRTLLQALDVPSVVYLREPMPHHPEVVTKVIGSSGQVDYSAAMADLKRASVVAIPLLSQGLAGFSELMDAMALAKPVVMTENDHFRPEDVGCGLSVMPGDVEGWRNAIASVTPEMGRRGRRYVEKNDYDSFSLRVAELLEGMRRA